MATVAFTGSRSLPTSALKTVSGVVGDLVASGNSLSVGCAVGADAAVVSSALALGGAGRLSIFAVGGSCGSGFAGPHSAVEGVRAAETAGASMQWWAGGAATVRLRSRLVGRSLACMGSASSVVGFVSAFPSRPWSGDGPWFSCGSGSWSSLASVAVRGGSIVVFPFGEAASTPLPALPVAGVWVRAGEGVWLQGWRFEPDLPFAASQTPSLNTV